MKKLEEYIEKSRRATAIKEFPAAKDYDYTVAFIQPELNSAEGLYKSLIPAFWLNKNTTIRAFSVGISDVKNSISINQKKFELKQSLIKVADHLVFPFVSQPLREVITAIKEIKPGIKTSYHIDFNYYFIPDSYPFVKEYSGAEIISIIEDNITLVDQVIVSNRSLYNYLRIELAKKENIKGCGTNIVYQPIFHDKSIVPKLPEKSKHKKKRIGMVMNQSHFSDLNFIKGILKEFLKKHADKAELVLLGWDGMYKGKNYLSNINIEYHPTVPFYQYMEKLIELDVDCFIIPAKNNKFNNTSKNTVKYYEFTRIGKPVILPAIDPYKEIANHNDNAVLCDEKESWLFELEVFLKNPEKLEGCADSAYNSILDNDISDPENMKILLDIFQVKS